MDDRDDRQSPRRESRTRIPVHICRMLLVECGHKCSFPLCLVKKGLETHHINGDPNDHRRENLLVLCPDHHDRAHEPEGILTPRRCQQLKRTVAQFGKPMVADKTRLRKAWRMVLSGRGSLMRRRKLLGFIAENLLASLPGLSVDAELARRPTGEVDLILRSEVADPVLRKMGALIVVECDARKGNLVQKSDVADFIRHLLVNGWGTGFLFSVSGFTAEAAHLVAHVCGPNFHVILVGPDSVEEMIESDDRLESIRQLIQRALAGG